MSSFNDKKYGKTGLTKKQIKKKQAQQISKNTKKIQQPDLYLDQRFESDTDVYHSFDTTDRKRRMKNASYLTEVMKDNEAQGLNALFEKKSVANSTKNSPKRNYRWVKIFLLLFLAVSSYFIYYEMTSVYIPILKGKEISEVKEWATQNDVELKIEEIYSLKDAPNVVSKQSVSEKKNEKRQRTGCSC